MANLDFLTLLRTLAPQLPAPCIEYRFDELGGRKWRYDYAWPSAKLALECDGGQFASMGGRHNTDGDRWKMSEGAAQGWRILRFSPAMLRDEPAACVDMVARALECQ